MPLLMMNLVHSLRSCLSLVSSVAFFRESSKSQSASERNMYEWTDFLSSLLHTCASTSSSSSSSSSRISSSYDILSSRHNLFFVYIEAISGRRHTEIPISFLTHHDVEECQVAVGVLHEPGGGQGLVLPDLERHQEADRAQELELAAPDRADGEEAVEVVHGEAEDLGLRVAVLADLEHPVGDLPPQGRGADLRLDEGEVVGHRGQVAGLLPQERLQDAVVAEDNGVGVRPRVVMLVVLVVVTPVVVGDEGEGHGVVNPPRSRDARGLRGGVGEGL